LYVIIRRDGRADEQAGVAYGNLLLSKEGQQFVQKAGLVPIR
jgi:phosphate transport system substrate-binding protein